MVLAGTSLEPETLTTPILSLPDKVRVEPGYACVQLRESCLNWVSVEELNKVTIMGIYIYIVIHMVSPV